MKSTHQTLTRFLSQLGIVTLFFLGGDGFALAQTVTITPGGTATAPTTTVTNTKLPAALQITNVVLKGDGTTGHPFEIGSVAEWTAFATIANDPNQVYANAKLTADITFSGNHLQPGENQNWSYTHNSRIYKETFDGQGHTITLNQQTLGGSDGITSSYGGLFWHVGGATIKNLRIAGKIETKNSMSGAFIQNVNSTLLQPVTIENCISSVNNHWAGTNIINYGNFGSFVGDVHHDMTLNIKNCLMDGQFTTNNYTIGRSGGFVGITSTQSNNQASTINIKNSYFHPENIDNNYINFSYFCNSVASSGERDVHLNISQSYYSLPSTYTGTGQVDQGTAAPAAVADLLAGLNNNAEKVNDEDPWIVHNDTVYLAIFAKYVDMQDVPYGSSPTPTIVGNSGNATVTYKYKTQGAADNTYATYTPGTTILPLGNYTIKAIVPAANGWNAWESTMNFSVVKAAGTVTAAPTAVTTTLTYDGSDQTLLATGGTATGSFFYRIGDTGGWTTTLPKATNAGSYNIYYYATPDGNHTAIDDFGSAESPKGPIEVTIGKVPLTVTANNHSITYGDAPANNGVSYSGFVNSETSAVLGGTLTYAYSYEQFGNVGSYTITPSGLTSTNYTITFVPGTLTVGKKDVTVSGITASNKTYDGNATATIVTDNASFSGLVSSDVLTVSTTGTFDDANAGTGKTVTFGTLTLGGAKIGNYQLATTGQQTTTTADITKQALTVTANNHSITYGDVPANDGVSYSGFVNDETSAALSGILTYTYSYAQFDDVGDTYTITPSGLTSTNYAITFVPGTLTVGKKDVTVSGITAPNKTYDGNATATIVTDNASFSGLVSSDVLTVSTTGTFDDTNAGTGKAVTFGTLTLGGAKVGNYQLAATGQQTTTTADITKQALIVTANNHSITYGDVPANDGVSYSGFVNDETSAVLGGTLTYVYSYTQNGNVGSYTITPSGLTSTNYAITFVPGTLTVEKKAITTDWLNGKISLSSTSFVYNGNPQAPVVSITGMTEGTDYTIKYKKGSSEASSEKPSAAGTYTIVIAGMGNYSGEVITDKTFIIQEPEPEPEPETPKVVDSSKPVTIDGSTFYELLSDFQNAIKSTINVSIALPEEANTRTTVASGALTFSKGTDFNMVIRNLKQREVITFIFTGRLAGDTSHLRKQAAGTRSVGDQDLASGVGYEVIQDGDMVITLKSSEEPITIKKITISSPPTAIDGVKADGSTDQWYDLNGLPITQPTKKGIYIKNGQKVLYNPATQR